MMDIYGLKDKEVTFYLVNLDKSPLNIDYYDRPAGSYEGVIKFGCYSYPEEDGNTTGWEYYGFSKGYKHGNYDTIIGTRGTGRNGNR